MYFLRVSTKQYYKIKLLKEFFSNNTDFFRQHLPNYADFFRVHINKYWCFNPIQNGLFWTCSGMGGLFSHPKICHTYPTMMEHGSYTLPKEDPKNKWITWQPPWVLLTWALFHKKSAKFAISRDIDIDYILIYSF